VGGKGAKSMTYLYVRIKCHEDSDPPGLTGFSDGNPRANDEKKKKGIHSKERQEKKSQGRKTAAREEY